MNRIKLFQIVSCSLPKHTSRFHLFSPLLNSCLPIKRYTSNTSEPITPPPNIGTDPNKGRLFISFQCNICKHRNDNFMSKQAYTKGVVIIKCDSCGNNHLIADHLGWYDSQKPPGTIEDIMKSKNGESVHKADLSTIRDLVNGKDIKTVDGLIELLPPSIKEGINCHFKHENEQPTSEESSNCAICLEPPTTFGIMTGCLHLVCLACIRKWRKTPTENAHSCPYCRSYSPFIVPSNIIPKTIEERDVLIDQFKSKVSKIQCKYTLGVENKCPFGLECLYMHLPQHPKIERIDDATTELSDFMERLIIDESLFSELMFESGLANEFYDTDYDDYDGDEYDYNSESD